MPWNPSTFRTRHNRRATGKLGKKAAEVANAVLRRTGNDGEAIRVANTYVAKKQGRRK